jgi:hypothetical protein
MKRASSASLAGFLSAVMLGMLTSVAPAQVDGDPKQLEKPLKQAWRDIRPCNTSSLCTTYFDSFGVGILFADGTTRPFVHEQRLSLSPHECLERAREFLEQGDRSLAVQWVMASQKSADLREWMRLHPDAVIQALSKCCSPL